MAMLYYSIFMVSIGFLSIRSPSVSSFFSGECGNAILQYCYGFNRIQLWLLAQGLLQSLLSLQVSVPYYSIVIGFVFMHASLNYPATYKNLGSLQFTITNENGHLNGVVHVTDTPTSRD